jgi:DNA modification methylase
LWDKNPRSIKEKDFNRLKKQIQELGQYKPILITTDGTVIGGNMRMRAYQESGIEDIWVSVVNPKDEAELLKYALSDNDRAGYYDDDLLANLTSDYPNFEWADYAVDMDAPMTLDKVLADINAVEEDEAPEVSNEEPKSKLGEVYQLGRHRLMCGDSTKIEDVEKLMNGQKADIVFTDPPYGVDFQSNMRTRSDKFDVLVNDSVMLTDWIAPAVTFSTGWLLFCTTWKVLGEWLEIGSEIGELSNMIIWDKGGGGIGDLEHSLLTDYEIILAYNRGNKITGKRLGSVWSIGKDGSMTYSHPTQKPVELPALAIKTLSSGSVLDLFGGSGSTLIACEQLNRTCYMMELDPKYCDVIRKRSAKFIGKEEEWVSISPRI